MRGGKALFNLFSTPEFDESLRLAGGLFGEREMASESTERASQSQREEGTAGKTYVTERRGNVMVAPEGFRTGEQAAGH